MKSKFEEAKCSLEVFIANGHTEDDAAQQSGLSKGTIRKMRSGAAEDSFRPTIVRRAIDFFLGTNEADEEIVANYIARELSVNEEEIRTLREGLHEHYLVFRLSSRNGGLIVSHLRTDKTNNNYIKFVEKIRLRSAPFSPNPHDDYYHSGFVFFRRDNLYFWNVASSNLRTLSLRLWGNQRFERAVGGTIGRNVLGEPISQKIMLLHVPFSLTEIDEKIGDYADDPPPKEFDEMRRYLERLNDVSGSVLPML